MKKLLINKFSALLFAATFLFTACGEDFLDINDNPNNPTDASLDLLLVGAQAAMGFNTSRNIMEHTSIVAHQFYTLAISQYNFGGSDFDNDWEGIYTNAQKEFDEIIKTADEQGQEGFAGIARVNQAYLFSLLVDVFNDVPFSAALEGETNLFPEFDDAATIYTSLIDLVDAAIVNFDNILAQEAIPAIPADLAYGSLNDGEDQFEAWRKVAKTLKLKLLLNLRSVDAARAGTEINALVTEGDLILDADENFQFNWGSTPTPQNRHPLYQQEYEQGCCGFYMDNWLMLQMVSRNDPRLPHYFFRQGTYDDFDFNEGGDPELTPCLQRSDCASWDALFALGVDGYWGRDHGDPSGIPGDDESRTTFGLYPVGGSFDTGPNGGAVEAGDGAGGAGITPWLTSAMTNLFIAEAGLFLPAVTADPETSLENAIEESIEAVNNFSDQAGIGTAIPDSVRDDYVSGIMDEYDMATTDGGRMNVIAKEMLISTFGNPIEAYNVVRRADAPTDLSPSLSPLNSFPVRLPYPNGELTSNPNAPASLPSFADRVFWDVN